MKSMKTMLKLARAHARSYGARIWKGVRCGMYLTVGELLAVYRDQGFNRKGTAMRRHIATWMAEDMCVLEGAIYDESSAVWFDAPEDMDTLIMVRSEQCGGRYVTRIDRNDWPVLRHMHGIQEALA